MKAELEKELSALSLEEKNEVFTFLMPYVTPDFEENEATELMQELERRLEADKKKPGAAISLEEFNKRWAHIG
jgi:putative addiction module component (TIGR02574 family)